MQTRNYLKQNDTVILSRKQNGSDYGTCRIIERIGQGGSAVCYRAEYEGRIGTLKEFYPVQVRGDKSVPVFPLARTDTCALMVKGAVNAMRFRRACDHFKEAYHRLDEAKIEDPQNIVLNNYIPSYEILYGMPEDETDSAVTVYIWNVDAQSGITWKDYLKQLSGKRNELSVRDLYDLITVMMSLTDCVKVLHAAGLLHLDIKPSNFLVLQNSEGEIHPGSISLFDIDTLYPIESRVPKNTGTKGYCAPEALHGRPDNRSDIYSIGCVLFESLMIGRTEKGLYDPADYQDLSMLVRESPFLEDAATEQEPYIASMLADILRKSLAVRADQRYDSCEDLLADIRAVRDLLGPAGEARIRRKHSDADPASAIQALLYEHPLYEHIKKEDMKPLRILVAGSGKVTHIFLDECLQAVQSMDRMAEVTVLTKRPEVEREVYLEFRPALADFVNVNGTLHAGQADDYAHLNFTDSDPASPEEIVRDAFRDGQCYDYAFVSDGEEASNRACAEALFRHGGVSAVYYAAESEGGEGEAVYPVNVISSEPLRKKVPELDEMAFRTHLSWYPSMNIDVKKEQIAFRDRSSRKARYNYRSSLASAMAVKYKLWSVGIDSADAKQAAEAFRAYYYDPANKVQIAAMIAAEHRRWVISLAAEGWTAPAAPGEKPDYNACVLRRNVKDPVRKIHPCLVHSTAEMPLLGPDWKNRPERWDDPDISTEGLDELDAMSVELHRCFLRHTEELKHQQILYTGDMDALRRMCVADGPEATAAYHEFEFAVKNILGGNYSFARELGHYTDKFLDSFKSAPVSLQKELAGRAAGVKKTLFPIIEWCAYRDYKNYDRDLIEMIPFILTYPLNTGMAMAFDDCCDAPDDMKRAFANVAAPIAVCPSRLLYLISLDDCGEADFLLPRMRAAMEFLTGRLSHCRIAFEITCSPAMKAKAERLEQMLTGGKWQPSRVRWHIRETASPDTYFAGLLRRRSVSLFDGSTSLFRNREKQEAFLMKVRSHLPVFTYENKTFTCDDGCTYLTYAKEHAYLRVSDLLSLTIAPKADYELPDFPDSYRKLWGIMREAGFERWHSLCEKLAAYEQNRKPVLSISTGEKKFPEPVRQEYYFPSFAFKGTRWLLEQLRYHGIVSAESDLYSSVAGTGRLELVTSYDIADELRELFARPQLLISKEMLQVRADRNFTVRCSDPEVTDLVTDSAEEAALLETLADAGCLYKIKVREQDGERRVSFIYPSSAFRKILTDSLELVRIYVYYEIRETGLAGDMALLHSDGADLLVTRGFRVLAVRMNGAGGSAAVSLTDAGDRKTVRLNGVDDISDHLAEAVSDMLRQA